jgi:hypothetical protein
MGVVVRIRTRHVNARQIDVHRRYLLHVGSIWDGVAMACSIQHRQTQGRRRGMMLDLAFVTNCR